MQYPEIPWPEGVLKPRSAPPLTLAPSDGPQVINWIQANCRHGEGDRWGERVQLELFQKLFLCWLYEKREDGRYRYRRAYLETPKNSGKTPLAAFIAAYQLAHQRSAVIPVAAASFEQAGLLFGDLRTCVTESPSLRQTMTAFENEIQITNGPGRAYRVAAIAGTNDGQRPSTFLADEIAEWQGPKSRVHLVLSNGCSKRRGSLQLNTSTPGFDKETLCGRLHDHGVRVNKGEIVDGEYLFVWWGAEPDKFDLSTPDGLRAAIRGANPAADLFVDVESVAAKFSELPLAEFQRYFLAMWTTAAAAWLPAGAWDACAAPGLVIPDGADVVLAVDGSHNSDSTAVVAVTCTPIPHIEVVDCWEKDDTDPDWKVDILDVEDAIKAACRRWQVREVAFDPFRWQRSMQQLESDGVPVTEYPQTAVRLAPATSGFYQAVLDKQLTHSGDPRLKRHMDNATLKTDARGSRISKETKYSTRRIDLAICAVMAFDRASVPAEDDYDVMASVL
jgi:phage terminase large subunit-like protein